MILNEKHKQKIETAMEIVKDNHRTKQMEYGHLEKSDYKRKWIWKPEEDGIVIALDGTPPKGFVVVLDDGSVTALNQSMEVIREL